MKRNYFLTGVLLVFLSSNLFSQWVNQPIQASNNFFSCSFPSASTGFVVGSTDIIMKTTNGGQNWLDISFAGKEDLNSVWFINENTGWIASTNDTLYKTTNNGVSWSASFNLQSQGYRVFFVNQLTGWAMGAPKLFRTTDGGSSWNLINSSVGTDFTFVDANTGWMSTYSSGTSSINKTTDGGATWNFQFMTTDFRVIYAFNFVNATTGWASGYREIVLKTTDGGANWIQQRDMNNSVGLYWINFVNANTGWFAGDNGEALSTTDGGSTWNVLNLFSGRFEQVQFVNQTTGWIVGGQAKIYKTTNLGGLTGNVSNSGIASEFSLNQNYPNPFNPSTVISYSIPKNEFVTLKVFDAIGREVTTLVNENETAGNYEITFDASQLSTGIYFYRIEAGEYTVTKKMLLIK